MLKTFGRVFALCALLLAAAVAEAEPLDAFKDLDPEGVWKDFHDTYMPWKAQGVFVTGI